MRLTFTAVLTLAYGCGGPVGLPVAELPDDTGGVTVATRGALQGSVVDADGAPLADAHLVTVPRGHEASTDVSGAFLLDWLPPGEYRLVVSAAGYEPVEQGSWVIEAGEATVVELSLEPAGAAGVVTVTATGPDGAPLVGALVSASTGASATSDAAGVARLDGVAGEAIGLWIEDSEGALWPRSLLDVSIPAGGGLQWQAQLSGRPPADASYVGSTLCGFCHSEPAAAQAAGPHAQAHVQQPSQALLDLFTTGAELDLGGATATLWLDGDQPVVTLLDSRGDAVTFTVESYLGDPERSTVPVVRVDEQSFPLPLAWRAGLAARSTYPDSAAALAPFERERWFGEDGSFAFGGAGPEPRLSADASCLPCHSAGYSLTIRDDGGVDLAYASSSGRYDGVGCEACHGPGGGHTSSTDPAAITAPARLDAARADEACGQCHSRTQGNDSGLPHPHAEPGRFMPGHTLADFAASVADHWPSGAAAVGRMQLDEHRLSLHGDAGSGLRCLDCHQVHGALEPAPALLRGSVDDNALCDACHLAGTFGGSHDAVLAHAAHLLYLPEGAQEGGRCVGCHMPPTASDGWWSEQSGAGDRTSHRFTALSPADTLALFDAAGASELELGAFPPHACSDCHAWNAWYWQGFGWDFAGPHGDPRLASTHEAFQASWEELYP